MKKRNLFVTLGLALGLGIAGLTAATLSSDKVERVVKAENYSRYSVLITNSNWTADNAVTMIWNGTETWQLDVDSEIGSTVTIGKSSYTLHTAIVDIETIPTDYGTIQYARRPVAGSTWYNQTWTGWAQGIRSGQRNVMEIGYDGSSFTFNEWGAMYWKLTTYSGVESYATLSDATKNANLVVNGSSVADPTNAPTGMEFSHWCTDAALTNAWSGTVTSDLTLYAKYSSTTRTYNKYYYYDGEIKAFIGSDHPEIGSEYTPHTPDSPVDNTYYFSGWFYYNAENMTSDPVGTIEEVESGSEVTIYAVYETYNSLADGFIYYMSSDTGTTENYIYSYGGSGQFGTWPGTKIKSINGLVNMEHGVITFDGRQRNIYKIPYSSLANDTHIIINYYAGEGSEYNSQTGDLPLSNGCSYWFDAAGATRYYADGLAAFNFTLAVEAKRNAVSAHGDILDWSICGISASDAQTLCASYNSLTADARSLVDNSYTYTYLRTGGPNQDNISFYYIMEELAEIAGGVTLTGHSARNVGVLSVLGENSNNTLIIIAIAGVSLLALAGFFLLKRKEDR